MHSTNTDKLYHYITYFIYSIKTIYILHRVIKNQNSSHRRQNKEGTELLEKETLGSSWYLRHGNGWIPLFKQFNPWIMEQNNFLLYWVHLVPILFKLSFSKFVFLSLIHKLKDKKNYFPSSFSFLMQPYRAKYIKLLRTRDYSLEKKMRMKLVLWLFLSTVTVPVNCDCSCQLSYFIWTVLTHWFLHTHSKHWQQFQSFLLFSCWTNRTPHT